MFSIPLNFDAYVPLQSNWRNQVIQTYKDLLRNQRNTYEFIVSQINHREALGLKLSPYQATALAELNKLTKIGWSLSEASSACFRAETLIRELKFLLPFHLQSELLIQSSEESLKTFCEWVSFNQILYGAFQTGMQVKSKDEGLIPAAIRRFPKSSKGARSRTFSLPSLDGNAVGEYKEKLRETNLSFHLKAWMSKELKPAKLQNLKLAFDLSEENRLNFYRRIPGSRRLSWHSLLPVEEMIKQGHELSLLHIEGRIAEGSFEARFFQTKGGLYRFSGLTASKTGSHSLAVEVYSETQAGAQRNAAIITPQASLVNPFKYNYIGSSEVSESSPKYFNKRLDEFLEPSLEALSQLHKIFTLTEAVGRSKHV